MPARAHSPLSRFKPRTPPAFLSGPQRLRFAAPSALAFTQTASMIQPPQLDLPIESGNAGSLDTNQTGWMIGFSGWSKREPHNLRHLPFETLSQGLRVKWFSHSAGDPNGEEKPVSTGQTISILVSESSHFRIEFSDEPTFPPARTQVHTLQRMGDFVIWGSGLHHRAFGLRPATILTIRWEPQHRAA